MVAEGINEGEAAAADQRRLLQLIGELTDDELIALCSYSHRYSRDEEWYRRHTTVLRPISATMDASPQQVDAALLRDLRTSKLLRLGVLREKPSANGRSTTRDLAPLGRHVLRTLGLLDRDEF